MISAADSRRAGSNAALRPGSSKEQENPVQLPVRMARA